MTLAEALGVLALSPPPLRGVGSYEEASEMLREWKEGALRARFRELVREWHPDLAGPDQADERNRRTAQIVTAYQAVRDGLEVRRSARPQPSQCRCVIVVGGTILGGQYGMSIATTTLW